MGYGRAGKQNKGQGKAETPPSGLEVAVAKWEASKTAATGKANKRRRRRLNKRIKGACASPDAPQPGDPERSKERTGGGIFRH